jgi:large subunit ribosomal protein L6
MSKLAKKPITIAEGVSISQEGSSIKVSGGKGDLSFVIPLGIEVKIEEGLAKVQLKDKKSVDLKPALGLTRSLIANMIQGISKGFEKKLELSGVGYRAQVSGKDLTLSVGFSHPVKITADEGLDFAVAENIITVSGIDKEKVGNMAARIRDVRTPDPYKEKGIKYMGERIRRKVGKAAKAMGTTKQN